jgi:hypothetical protein
MFHPLSPDSTNLRDTDIQQKITEATRKYNISARLGNIDLCNQLSMIIEELQVELRERYTKKSSTTVNNTPLDKLVKID